MTRKFGDLVAVDHISFSVRQGEIFGLLGPNGAGKTTTINMLTTLLHPTSGQARVGGYDVISGRGRVRESIGVVFQEPALDTNLTGRENLDFHAMMYGIDRKSREARIGEVLDLIEMTDKANVLVENYSGGMKRRLEIGRGLIHHPKVLFLDEPTLGLDAQTRRRIWEYVLDLKEKTAITIVITTHYMEEADYLCDRIAIMDHGRIAALDTPERLKDALGGDVITLEMANNGAHLADRLKGASWVKGLKESDHSITLTVERGETHVPEIVMLAQGEGAEIASVHLRKPSLEDVYLHFTGKSMREKEVS
ncbi:MAG TPA: ATP-binding cassette domain-containing protein, partial [Methanomicrobiales archaeon]|nr:ATP-binding cassette domain-containing protein [Methanomicrobiales archaeon]